MDQRKCLPRPRQKLREAHGGWYTRPYAYILSPFDDDLQGRIDDDLRCRYHSRPIPPHSRRLSGYAIASDHYSGRKK